MHGHVRYVHLKGSSGTLDNVFENGGGDELKLCSVGLNRSSLSPCDCEEEYAELLSGSHTLGLSTMNWSEVDSLRGDAQAKCQRCKIISR